MRLCTFEVTTLLGRFERLGAVFPNDFIMDLNAAYAWLLHKRGQPHPNRFADVIVPPDILRFLEGGKRCMEAASEVVQAANALSLDAQLGLCGPRGETVFFQMANVRLKAAVPRPASLRDFLAFEEHAKRGAARRKEELIADWYEVPVYYKGNHRAIYGPEDEIPWPSYTKKFDFECEIACVIGLEGRNIKVADALDHVAGYMLLNDFSARDIQRIEMMSRMGPAKGKDFATAFGPHLITSDEMREPPADMRMIVRVNEGEWSQGRYGDRYWSFAQMISHVSQEETLYPGDVFGCGTFFTGCGMDLDRWVKPGDVVELESENLGILRNKVGKPKSDKPLRFPRKNA